MRLKKLLKSPGAILSAAGAAALAVLYILWLRQSHDSTWGKLLALLSAVMFAGVCLRFVPGWMRFWNPREALPEPETGSEPPHMGVKIFAGLLAYAAAIIGLVYILRGAAGYGWNFPDYLSFWTCTDSRHYLDIARDWYLSQGEWDRLVQLVFLPGYPLAVRAVSLLAGDYLISGLLVSAFCFAGAGAVFYRLVRLDHGHEHAMRALLFLCLIPGAFFFAAPMSESLFLLLSAGCLCLARRRKWFFACLLGGLAAFTRSLGLVLFVPVLFEMAACCARDKKGPKRFLRFLLLLLIPCGFACYCLINYQVSGDYFKYMEYQSVHWGQRLGLFFNTAAYQLDNAVWRWESDQRMFWGLWLPNLLSAFGALALMLPAAKRLRPSYTAYFLAYFFVAIGATWLLSAPRYLAALLPLPIAMASLTEKNAAATALTLTEVLAGFLYLLAFLLRWQVW